MAILIVPSNKYNTIQEAVDAANSGDEIRVTPGTYNESFAVINKNNIGIYTANYNENAINNDQVTLNGSDIGGTAITIEGDNITIAGFVIVNFSTGISVAGNKNKLIYDIAGYCTGGFTIAGNYNKILSCILEFNDIVGLNIQGNYNLVEANRCIGNARGITALVGDFKGNIFYKNIITNNQQANIRVSNPKADMTIYRENTIADSDYGILSNFGRVAIISNLILKSVNVGVVYKDNGGIILDNNLANNDIGLYLETCNTVIAGNVVQQGNTTGIAITGDKNCAVRNVVTKYKNTGLIVNGCKNNVCNNELIKNEIDLIINGIANCTECKYDYCSGISCMVYDNYLKMLDIFNKPKESFFR